MICYLHKSYRDIANKKNINAPVVQIRREYADTYVDLSVSIVFVHHCMKSQLKVPYVALSSSNCYITLD